MWKSFGVLALLLLFMLPALAEHTNAARTAEEIRACSRANLPEMTMVQNMSLTSTDRAGKTQTTKAKFYLKRFADEDTRGTLQVRAPIDVSGISYLWVDTANSDRIFLYLPSVMRVRRVTGKSAAASLLGSDFSYEDIKHLRGIASGGAVSLLEAASVQNRPVQLVRVIPARSDESTYRKQVFKIDRETCVPLEIEFFEDGDSPRKRLVADSASLEQIGGRWLARRLTMYDLREDTHSEMLITEVEYDDKIPDGKFNRYSFYLGAYLPDAADSNDKG